MVNCNPETVSTDYDTSDRLYFEPLRVEEVLSICERERPEGVVIQFGGQTPLKLARRDRGGRLPDSRNAVRGGRPGRGPRALRGALRAARDRRAGVGDGGLCGRGCGGGRARRLPGAGAALVRARRAEHADLLRRGGGARGRCRRRAPARRPLPRERDRARRRRALRRDRHLHRRGHAARRGGRRPLRRLELRAARAHSSRSSTSSWSTWSRGSGPSSAWSGCSTSSSRSPTDGSTCWRRTRAPRARCRSSSKATGVNLVEAACRLAAGATLAELDLPSAPALGSEREGRRAPVLQVPRRRPGARARDALDRRGDGQRLRPADRLRPRRARRGTQAADRWHRLPFRAGRGQGRRRQRRPRARRARLQAARDGGHGAYARRRRAGGRGRAQGDRGRRRSRRSSTCCGAAAATW